MRRTLRTAAILAPVVPLLPLALGSLTAASSAGLAVDAGESVFWTGPHLDGGDARDASVCGVSVTCPTFEVAVGSGGDLLRVAIDVPSREDGFTVDLIGPDGSTAGSATSSNQFNAEAFAEAPAAGTWTVRVRPRGATDTAFRLRAKLEVADAGAGAHAAGPVEPLLPNLKAVPPYEFGFVAPANPLNAMYPPDTVNPPLDVAGVHPLSCAVDEMAPRETGGGAATKCLRLTSGPINVGRGPFDLRFEFVDDVAARDVHHDAGLVHGPMTQVIHHSDGSITSRDAGTYSFHYTHGHFHTDQVLTYELFSVADPVAGTLAPAGEGTKSGFCPADQLFGEWTRFVQDPPGTFGEGDSAAGGNCFSPNEGFIGLTAGWGDVYRWQRPGQYIEFGANGDGDYVARTTVDMGDMVLEADETDNAAYALIRVAGEHVEVLERGQGSDPWDPDKVVFHGAGPASVDALDAALIEGGVAAGVAGGGGPAGAGGSGPAAPAGAPDVPGAEVHASSSTAAGTLAATGGEDGVAAAVLAALVALLGARATRSRRAARPTQTPTPSVL